MTDLEILWGGYISVFALGWVLGRSIKAIRQFFDLM